jgi:hypothetical protein
MARIGNLKVLKAIKVSGFSLINTNVNLAANDTKKSK